MWFAIQTSRTETLHKKESCEPTSSTFRWILSRRGDACLPGYFRLSTSSSFWLLSTFTLRLTRALSRFTAAGETDQKRS